MTSNFARISILVLGAATAAFAQNIHTVKANIPFDFAVSGTTMPAGHYLIDTNATTTIALYEVDSHKNAIVPAFGARTLDTQKSARLVFHRYGERYFLYQVWTTDLDTGREVPASKQERALAKGPANSKRVIIAASN